MALGPCRECEKEVSDTARTCPHCGVAFPVATAANKMQMVGGPMMVIGCLLTLFITIPFIVILWFLLS